MKITNTMFDQGFVGGEIKGYGFSVNINHPSTFNYSGQVESFRIFRLKDREIVAYYEGNNEWCDNPDWQVKPTTAEVREIVKKVVEFANSRGVI